MRSIDWSKPIATFGLLGPFYAELKVRIKLKSKVLRNIFLDLASPISNSKSFDHSKIQILDTVAPFGKC